MGNSDESPISEQRWQDVRGALADAGRRFTELVRAAPDPLAMVTPEWSVSDMTAHVTVIAMLYTTVLAPAPVSIALEATERQIPHVTLDMVSEFNAEALREYSERGPGELSEQLLGCIDEMLRITDDQDPARPVPWLGDARVPVAGILAHLLNELLIHGWDIARATGTPWPIPARESALFFDLFLVGMLRNGTGQLLDSRARPQPRRVPVEFRSAFTTPVTLVLHDGQVTVEPPGAPDTAARVTFDPATFALMFFDRISKPRAVLSGKISIRGRRLWLLPSFLRTVRGPG
jgi:uncharacterized protein (TIGR03083 family)